MGSGRRLARIWSARMIARSPRFGGRLSPAGFIFIITTRNNSWVVGVGNDYDNAIARTPASGQTLVHQDLSPAGDTYWVQILNSPTLWSGSSVSLNEQNQSWQSPPPSCHDWRAGSCWFADVKAPGARQNSLPAGLETKEQLTNLRSATGSGRTP